MFSDLIDGAMARKTGRTDDFGAFLDSTLDRVADGALFAGATLYFAWVADDRLYTALCLVILVMGSATSYARAKADHLHYDAKVGIAERPDRLVGFLVRPSPKGHVTRRPARGTRPGGPGAPRCPPWRRSCRWSALARA